MRHFSVLIALLVLPAAAVGQKHELGLTLGGLVSQERGVGLDAVDITGGVALQANYGYRLINARVAALYFETHFLANPLRDVSSPDSTATRDFATLYVTPGLRLKLIPGFFISPYAAAGGGYALYEQSFFRLDGAGNDAPRFLHRGAVDFGGGVDVALFRWLGARFEVRDFYTGSPGFNLARLRGGQHNIVAGGGFVLSWGD